MWVILQSLAFSFAGWLGLYLLVRNPAKPLLRLTGLGLIAYALSLAAGLLATYAPTATLRTGLVRAEWFLVFLPALFWSGTLLHLLPEDLPWRPRLIRGWAYGLAPIFVLLSLIAWGTDWMFDLASGAPQAGRGYAVFALLVLLPLLACFALLLRTLRSVRPRLPYRVILAATLFFGLGTSLLIVPLDWLPRSGVVLLIGLDLLALGFAIAGLDAFDEGETLLPDAARSFAAAFLAVVIFGGQVLIAIALGAGPTFSLVVLLLAASAAAITLQTLSDPIQSLLDRLVLARFARLRQTRSDLRAASSALPRLNAALDPCNLAEPEFARLIRRAIGHLGDLPRLAASPLTRLSIIDQRLAARQAREDGLERAAELKACLSESILRLKPRGQAEFGTTAEWRYYNALYFLYVVGLKPYSRRFDRTGLKPIEREALDWFRANVPERTLYNWQNAAAKLVAEDLRAQDLRQELARQTTPSR